MGSMVPVTVTVFVLTFVNLCYNRIVPPQVFMNFCINMASYHSEIYYYY